MGFKVFSETLDQIYFHVYVYINMYLYIHTCINIWCKCLCIYILYIVTDWMNIWVAHPPAPAKFLNWNPISNVMIFCRWGLWKVIRLWGFPGGIHGKDANAGDISDVGLIPGLERSPGKEYGTPLQYSCLENPHGQRSQRLGRDWSDLARMQSSWTPWNLQEDTLLRSIIGSSVGKESAYNAGDSGSIPGLGRSLGEGNSYPLQYSGLENFMGCIIHGVAKSQTKLSDFTSLVTPRHWWLKQ